MNPTDLLPGDVLTFWHDAGSLTGFRGHFSPELCYARVLTPTAASRKLVSVEGERGERGRKPWAFFDRKLAPGAWSPFSPGGQE